MDMKLSYSKICFVFSLIITLLTFFLNLKVNLPITSIKNSLFAFFISFVLTYGFILLLRMIIKSNTFTTDNNSNVKSNIDMLISDENRESLNLKGEQFEPLYDHLSKYKVSNKENHETVANVAHNWINEQ